MNVAEKSRRHNNTLAFLKKRRVEYKVLGPFTVMLFSHDIKLYLKTYSYKWKISNYDRQGALSGIGVALAVTIITNSIILKERRSIKNEDIRKIVLRRGRGIVNKYNNEYHERAKAKG